MIQIKNSKLIIFIFIINFMLLINNVFAAYTITDISIDKNYIGGIDSELEVAFDIEGTLSEITSDYVILNISSDADPTGIDFNVIVDDTTFSGVFYITNSSTTTFEGWPKIQVNDTDVITVSGQAQSDTCFFDIENPIVGSIDNITSIDGDSFNNFYSKDLIVSFTPGSDAYTYISNYLIWIVDVKYLEDYDTYGESFLIDGNSTFTKTIDSVATEIPDGNYYFLLDLFDAAGNRGKTQDVIDTKVNIYFDNSSPIYDNPNIGIIGDDNILYTGENTFDLEMEVSDISGINSELSNLVIINPSGVQVAPGEISFTEDIFTYSASNTYDNADIFQIQLEVYDNVNNFINFDYNIVFDLQGPTIPGTADNFLDIDEDKNVTITWTASNDFLSGVKNYEIYRSTSDFTSVSSATKIHTTSDSSILSYEDDSVKVGGKRYYYGVVAVDYAGNKSDPIIDSIHSGPEVELEIADGDKYTNSITPKLFVEYSSDVNEMRFSCNESTWSSWIEVDGDSEKYNSFNITSGNGCNNDNEKKTIYVQVRSENDYPNRTSKAEDTINYDSIAPDLPSNIVIIENSDGSIELTWDESEDNNSNSVEYRLYYSQIAGVSVEDDYFETDDEYYIYNPNADLTFYFRLSAIDEAGNESLLTTEVSGSTQRIGPSFTLDLSSFNIVDDVIYVGRGSKIINIISDEVLNSTPTIRIKINSGSFITLPVNYTNLIASTDYNFQTSGIAIIKITGTDESLDSASDEFELVIDANAPVFDFNYTVPISKEDTNYSFFVTNFSDDIFRIQYLLDNKNEVCVKQFDSNSLEPVDFNCVFDSSVFSDGSYKLYVLAYDDALNLTSKVVDLVIDNVNELQNECDEFKVSVESLIIELDLRIQKLDQLLILVDDLDKEKLTLAKNKKDNGDDKYALENFVDAKSDYSQAKNILLELKDKLPSESIIRNINYSKNYDANIIDSVVNLTEDLNVSQDTIELYESGVISFDRNFLIQEIDSKKYFSTTLEFKNNSSSDQTITIVEVIPKSFETDVKNIVFNKEVEILVADPVIKCTFTIPANSSEILRYNKVIPITDVDVITKYNTIKFSDPIILSGDVSADKIIYDKLANYKLLTYIVLGMIVLIIILIILSLIAKKNKMSEEQLGKPSNKDVINAYFGKKDDFKVLEKSDAKSEVVSGISPNKNNSEDTKFKNDYDFIMNAIKKR